MDIDAMAHEMCEASCRRAAGAWLRPMRPEVMAQAAIDFLRSLPVEQRMEAMGMQQVATTGNPYSGETWWKEANV